MTIRKIAFYVHLYAGIVGGILLLVTGLTGSLIVFSNETDALLNEAAFHVPEKEPRVPLQVALDKVKKAYPKETAAVFYPARLAGETHRFTLRSPAGLRLVSVDPGSGDIVASRLRNRTFIGWTRDLHVQLLSGKNGETVVGIGGILLFLLCVTGLVVWFPKPGRKLTDGFKVRWSAGWKRQNYDLHRAGGLFVLVLLTVTAATGVALVFDDATGKVVSTLTRTPARPPRPATGTTESASPLPLDELRQKAEEALPGGELAAILLPRNVGEPVGFRKRFPGDWHHAGRSFVYIDPGNGKALRVDDSRAAPLGMRIINVLYPLHTGEWAGTPARVIQVFIGLAPGLLFLSGFLMWWNRSLARRFRPSRAVATQTLEADPA